MLKNMFEKALETFEQTFFKKKKKEERKKIVIPEKLERRLRNNGPLETELMKI